VPLRERIDGLSRAELTALRDLMKRYLEVCHHPLTEQRRQKWQRSSTLQPQPPIVWTWPDWRAWKQLIADDEYSTPEVTSARAFEDHMRKAIYHFEILKDDHACEPVMRVWAAVEHSGWGLEPTRIGDENANDAWHYDPPIKQESDFEKLRLPTLSYDEESTKHRIDAARELVGDLMPVEVTCWPGVDTVLIVHLCGLRGIDQVFLDMYERPDFLHRLLGFLTEGNLKVMEQAEAGGWLALNNKDDYTGSGAMGYTDELPAAGFAGRARFKDLWAHSEAQEYALVGPLQHEEFALQYQIRLLERYGLVCYGCCEALHRKFDLMMKIPRLRRISISPWCNIRVAAERLQNRYVYNWKPNPADLVAGWDESRIRAQLTEFLAVTKGCVVEMVMKDVQTLGDHPERLARWVEIARECVNAQYGQAN